jgi:Flp pilus assembly protein TadD
VLLATKNRDLAEADRALLDDEKARGGVYGDDARALVAWRMGDLERAKTASARAVSLGTPDPRLLLHRGIILVKSGDASGSALVERAMKMGLEHDPWARALVDGAAH